MLKTEYEQNTYKQTNIERVLVERTWIGRCQPARRSNIPSTAATTIAVTIYVRACVL